MLWRSRICIKSCNYFMWHYFIEEKKRVAGLGRGLYHGSVWGVEPVEQVSVRFGHIQDVDKSFESKGQSLTPL